MITTHAYVHDIHYSPSRNVCFVHFQLEDIFAFAEGQFVMIEASIEGKTIKRPYSIASTNKQLQEQKILSIVVKKTSEAGMSDRMTQHMQS
jgi:ferredoxin-NADP reductase